MKRSKEELARIHKEKCKELKEIRAKMAEDLGIDLHQRECTYEGYCSGTCPKCMQEELMLNAAIRKKQMEEADIKHRVAAAGLTMTEFSILGIDRHRMMTDGKGITSLVALAASPLVAVNRFCRVISLRSLPKCARRNGALT